MPTAKRKTTPSTRKPAASKKTAGGRKTSGSGTRKRTVRKKSDRRVQVPLWIFLAVVAVAVALFLFLTYSRPGRNYETGARVPPGNWKYGIDISHNNEGNIIWDSLWVMVDGKGRTVRDPYKAKEIKPVSFVFIKATEGASFVDRKFKENWKNAGKSGVTRGAYHFFRSSKDGELQARNFIKTVGDLRFKDLPPVLDIETIHRGCSRKVLNDRALQWLRTVEKRYGKTPIVYASSSFIRDNLDKEITDNYPIWVAHYEKARPSWEDWTWWQVTDQAVVKGVPGLVDLDVMREE